MAVEPTEQQIAVLRAVCDTFVPSIERSPDPHGFWPRSATDVGADRALVEMPAPLPDAQAGRLLHLPDAIGDQGFVGASQKSREQLLKTTSLANRDAAVGIAVIGGRTRLVSYGGS